jgi:ketosteroid isomerase-like protein
MKLQLTRLFMVAIAAIVLASVKMYATAGHPKILTGPTAENALAADHELARALQNNDSLGIVRMLDKDWAVITSHGDIAEGLGVFPTGIRTGFRTLTAMELSEPRVRLFGNVAVITTKVRLAGQTGGKTFDMHLRQTDTWLWKNGAWKCILTHESNLNNP